MQHESCFFLLSLQAEFPANTNILYVDLSSVESVASSNSEKSLPGMVLNTKKQIAYEDSFGNCHRYFICLMVEILLFLFFMHPSLGNILRYQDLIACPAWYIHYFNHDRLNQMLQKCNTACKLIFGFCLCGVRRSNTDV